MEWQPIETAPKDGTVFIGHDHAYRYPEMICWNLSSECWQEGELGDLVDIGWEPTFWMPIPPLPDAPK